MIKQSPEDRDPLGFVFGQRAIHSVVPELHQGEALVFTSRLRRLCFANRVTLRRVGLPFLFTLWSPDHVRDRNREHCRVPRELQRV